MVRVPLRPPDMQVALAAGKPGKKALPEITGQIDRDTDSAAANLARRPQESERTPQIKTLRRSDRERRTNNLTIRQLIEQAAHLRPRPDNVFFSVTARD